MWGKNNFCLDPSNKPHAFACGFVTLLLVSLPHRFLQSQRQKAKNCAGDLKQHQKCPSTNGKVDETNPATLNVLQNGDSVFRAGICWNIFDPKLNHKHQQKTKASGGGSNGYLFSKNDSPKLSFKGFNLDHQVTSNLSGLSDLLFVLSVRPSSRSLFASS